MYNIGRIPSVLISNMAINQYLSSFLAAFHNPTPFQRICHRTSAIKKAMNAGL
jgi:hypothetical protein